MEPSSDRSFHPSDNASLRSSFRHEGTPAYQRSNGRVSRRGGFGEVKSPSVASGAVSVASAARGTSATAVGRGATGDAVYGGWGKRGGVDGDGDDGRIANQYRNIGRGNGNDRNASNDDNPQKKTLAQHLHKQNLRAPRNFEMDIESADKDQPTWASRDWCAEAHKSRAFLRNVDEDNEKEEDDVWNRNRHQESPSNTARGKMDDEGDNNYHDGGERFDGRRAGAVNAAVGGDPGGSYRRNSSGSLGQRIRPQQDRAYHDRTQNTGSHPHSGWGDDGGGGAERKDGGYNNSSRTGPNHIRQQSEGHHYRNGSDYGHMPDRAVSNGRPRETMNSTNNHDPQWHEERDGPSRGGGGSAAMGGRNQAEPEFMERANGRPSQHRGRDPHQQWSQQQQQQQPHYHSRSRSRGPPLSNENGGPTRPAMSRQVDSREPRPRSPGPSSGDPQQQQQQQQQSYRHHSRSQSRGPTNEQQPPRSGTPGSPGDRSARPRSQSRGHSINRPTRSNAPGPSAGNSQSSSMDRPRKKVGCIGGSSDMTHRQRLNNPMPSNHLKSMKSFEKEMRHRRKHDRMEELNNSSNKLRGQDKHGRRESEYSNASSSSQGRSQGRNRGRSQGRNREPLQSQQDQPQQYQEATGQDDWYQHRMPMDPPSSRSNNKFHSPNTVTASAQAHGPQQPHHRPASRGKKSQSRPRPNGNDARASPDDHDHYRTRIKSKSPHPKNNNKNHDVGVTCDSRTTTSSKNSSTKSGKRGTERLGKIVSGKSAAPSCYSSSTSSTPETGPLSSCNSGRSSSKGKVGGAGSFLKYSATGSLLKSRGRMPPSTPPQEYKDDGSSYGGSRPATPNRVPSVNGDASTVGSGISSHKGDSTAAADDEEIMTCMFDRKGYCVRHPRVRLRKKKLLGGWNVLITNCPDCCVEEMGRLKRVRKRQAKAKKDKGKEGVSVKKKKEKKKKKDQKKNRGDNLQQRNRSRSRARMPEVKNDPKIRSMSKSNGRGGRGKSREDRQRSSSRGPYQEMSRPSSSQCVSKHNNDPGNSSSHIFEFDINLDERGDVTSPRSVKTAKSQSSKKSSKSVRTDKSGKSARTNKSAKSTQTNKSRKSTRTNKSDKSTRTNKSSKSRSGRSKSRDKSRDKSFHGGAGNGEKVVSRGSHAGSSQRFIRQNNRLLRVAKMPFTDRYKRPGKYTGEINEHGQPDGKGTLRYNNGMVFEGIWKEGRAEDMDANMIKAKEGFIGNWKTGTPAARKEREKRKEQDIDDLRSFISQSVRSGSTGPGGGGSFLGGGSQYGSGNNGSDNGNGNNRNSRRPSPRQQGGEAKEEVHQMPWSDVNGFSGHYTGEVNHDQIPDGRGHMQYSNGVVEKGIFCNGVYQPPDEPPGQSPYVGGRGDSGMNQGIGIPSSSMSVWSLKSTPTMAFAQGGHNVVTGKRPVGGGSVMGAPTSVHLGGGGMHENTNDDQY